MTSCGGIQLTFTRTANWRYQAILAKCNETQLASTGTVKWRLFQFARLRTVAQSHSPPAASQLSDGALAAGWHWGRVTGFVLEGQLSDGALAAGWR